jgi:hypothetical protein
VKDAEGSVIQEAPLPIWADFLQMALDFRDRGDHRKDGHKHPNGIAGTIKTSAGDDGDFCNYGAISTER